MNAVLDIAGLGEVLVTFDWSHNRTYKTVSKDLIIDVQDVESRQGFPINCSLIDEFEPAIKQALIDYLTSTSEVVFRPVANEVYSQILMN